MYYSDFIEEGTYLVHHGIKGQKWGIRRYQNPDGSLTEAGKKHYQYSDKEQKDFADHLVKMRRAGFVAQDLNKKVDKRRFKKVDPNKIEKAKNNKKSFDSEDQLSGFDAMSKAIEKKFKNNENALNKAYLKVFGNDDFNLSAHAKLEALIDEGWEAGDVNSYLKEIGITDFKVKTNDPYMHHLATEYDNSITEIARDMVGKYGDIAYASMPGGTTIHLAEDYVRRYIQQLDK